VVGKERGKHLRQMADLGDQSIVVFGGQHFRDRSDRSNDILHCLQPPAWSGSDRTEEVPGFPEKSCARGFGSGTFRPCHRMPSDKWEPALFRKAAYRALRAAKVRDELSCRIDLFNQLKDLADGGRQNEQFGVLRITLFDNAEFPGSFEDFGPVDTDYSDAGFGGLQRQSEGTAHEPHSEDGDGSHYIIPR
jgi:hypothetical protein